MGNGKSTAVAPYNNSLLNCNMEDNNIVNSKNIRKLFDRISQSNSDNVMYVSTKQLSYEFNIHQNTLDEICLNNSIPRVMNLTEFNQFIRRVIYEDLNANIIKAKLQKKY
jgi:hypothetical protein